MLGERALPTPALLPAPAPAPTAFPACPASKSRRCGELGSCSAPAPALLPLRHLFFTRIQVPRCFFGHPPPLPPAEHPCGRVTAPRKGFHEHDVFRKTAPNLPPSLIQDHQSSPPPAGSRAEGCLRHCRGSRRRCEAAATPQKRHARRCRQPRRGRHVRRVDFSLLRMRFSKLRRGPPPPPVGGVAAAGGREGRSQRSVARAEGLERRSTSTWAPRSGAPAPAQPHTQRWIPWAEGGDHAGAVRRGAVRGGFAAAARCATSICTATAERWSRKLCISCAGHSWNGMKSMNSR